MAFGPSPVRRWEGSGQPRWQKTNHRGILVTPSCCHGHATRPWVGKSQGTPSSECVWSNDPGAVQLAPGVRDVSGHNYGHIKSCSGVCDMRQVTGL